jgi:hypothetical protein
MKYIEYVYFMREKGIERGPVKIGCSWAPMTRCKAFSPWSPRPLEIVATISGDKVREASFHTLFQHLHSHSEWFMSAPELEACIAKIQAGTFDVSILPDGPSAVRSARSIEVHKRRKARAAA